MMIVNMRPELYSLSQDDIEIPGLWIVSLVSLDPTLSGPKSAQVAGADSTGEGWVPGLQCSAPPSTGQHWDQLGLEPALEIKTILK